MTNAEQWAAWKDAIAALEAQGYRFVNRGKVGGRYVVEVWRGNERGAVIRDSDYLRAVAVAAEHAERIGRAV